MKDKIKKKDKKKGKIKDKKKVKIENRIPTEEEINPYGAQSDAEYAVEHFYGKNVEEASKQFFINAESRAEDLFWMGVKAYFYYINSIKEYLLSEEGNDDSTFISCTLNNLKYRLKNEEEFRIAFEDHKEDILDILLMIQEIIKKKDFHDEWDFYADMPDLVSQLMELCKS